MEKSPITSLLHTDFYQLSMAWAYMLTDNKANDITGFEAYCRDIKDHISSRGFYVFKGEETVRDFISSITKEIRTPKFRDRFISLVHPKVKSELWKAQKKEVLKKWDNLSKEFEFEVYPDGVKVVPFAPVFQFRGPRWIGQLLETPILNLINGATGLNTQNVLNGENPDRNLALKSIVYPEQNSDDLYMNAHIAFQTELGNRAKEYRESTKAILLEAGLRRAPGFSSAMFASGEALLNGWDGTSNVATIDIFDASPSKVGGTMAHAFVMSFESELESFRAWDEVFPGSTILIDTYDVTRAAEMLVKYNIKPNDVRIDSDPLDEYAIEVRAIFDSAGWNDVGIFISGDLTPEVLRDYEDRGVPFTKCMAGSKYLNNGWGNDCNCGFVYKIVEYINENGNRVLPVKLSTGKRSYPGLKRFDNVAGEIQVSIGDGTGLDMSALRNQVTLDTPMELVTENK